MVTIPPIEIVMTGGWFIVLNTLYFLHIEDGFTNVPLCESQVDPDCVFFPARLRGHVHTYVGQNVFFLTLGREIPNGDLLLSHEDMMGSRVDNKGHPPGCRACFH